MEASSMPEMSSVSGDSSSTNLVDEVEIIRGSRNSIIYEHGRLGYADSVIILKNLDLRRVSKEVPDDVKDKEVYVYHKSPGDKVLHYWRLDGYQWKDGGSDIRPKTPTDQTKKNMQNKTDSNIDATVYVRVFHLLHGKDRVDFRRLEYTLYKDTDSQHIVVNYVGKFTPSSATRAPHGNVKKAKESLEESEYSDSETQDSASEHAGSACRDSGIRPHRKSHPSVREKLSLLQAQGVKPVESYRQALLESSEESADLQPRNKKQAYNVAHALAQKMAGRDDIYEIYAFSRDNPGSILLFDIAESVDIVVSHRDMLIHVNAMHELLRGTNQIICYNYDTTYKTGQCFTSILSVRHRFFKEVPIVPVAVLFHAYTDTDSHKPLFAKVVEMIPAFNSKTTVIVTDREKSIINAIRQLVPQAIHFFCWNHILKNVADWVNTNIDAELKTQYKEEVKSLLSADDIPAYNKILSEYQQHWEPLFNEYYQDHVDDDVKLSSKWRLEQCNLYSPESGITNNPAESVNHMFKTVLSHKVSSLNTLVYSVHFLQVTLLIDIHRGLGLTGEYHLITSEYERSKRFPSLSLKEVRVNINEIPSLVCDGKYEKKLADVNRRTFKLGRNPSVLGLAKYFIEEERIFFLPKMKCFVVRGLGNRKQNVDIGINICTCLRQGLCAHLLAVLISVGQDDEKLQKQISKRQSTSLNSLYKRTTPQSSGKKGGPLSKLGRTRKPQDKAGSDNSVSHVRDETFSAQADEQIDGTTEKEPASETESTDRTQTALNLLKKFEISELPVLSIRNKDDVVLHTHPEKLKLLDLKSLQTKLKRSELQILSRVIGKEYSDEKSGYMEDNVINQFLKSTCENQNVICVSANEVDCFFSYEDVGLPGVQAPVLITGDKVRVAEMVLMPHNLADLHWQLIIAWPKQKCLTELNPATGFIPLDIEWKHKLEKELNLMFGYDMWEKWAEKKIDIAVCTDAVNCGVYVCYYAYTISRGLSASLQIDPIEFRSTIMGEIMGGCVLNNKLNTCCKCLLDLKTKGEKKKCVKCHRCKRLSHAACVETTSNEPFVCPRT